MKFWQVDAFTNKIFRGNPAAVFIFDDNPEDSLLQNIATEMNVSETAFVIGNDSLIIRWFTPQKEVNLCGHATLAAAHILWENNIFSDNQIVFQSKSGPLIVSKSGSEYTLDFPSQVAIEKKEYHELVHEIIGIAPEFVGSNGEDCMVVVKDDHVLRNLSPDYRKICMLEERGLIVTSKDTSGKYDYVYRAFFPKLSVPEDPVTGSANTCLAPYWSKYSLNQKLEAAQLSQRGGTLRVEVEENRVLISGEAITVIEGEMTLS
jgi:PhzF family phenazine biosynthesis protein